MSPSPDSSTRRPTPLTKASSYIGATITFSDTSCWTRCSIASRLAQDEIVDEPIRRRGPRLGQAGRERLAGHRLHDAVVERVEDHERRDDGRLRWIEVRRHQGRMNRPRDLPVRRGADRDRRHQEEQRDGDDREELHRVSCRPMKSRISAIALSASALGCWMKPWRAPGKWTRSTGPPACWYAWTNASVIAAGTLSSSSGCATHTGGSARASRLVTMRVTLASAI